MTSQSNLRAHKTTGRVNFRRGRGGGGGGGGPRAPDPDRLGTRLGLGAPSEEAPPSFVLGSGNMALSLVLLVALSLLVAVYCIWLVFLRGRGLPRSPSPPVVSGLLPLIGCGLHFVRSPRDFLQECRRKVSCA